MKKYPDYSDFPIEQIIYGLGAPFVGIGVYTLDRKFSWPDREGTTKEECDAWVKHLEENGYFIPKEYFNAYFEASDL